MSYFFEVRVVYNLHAFYGTLFQDSYFYKDSMSTAEKTVLFIPSENSYGMNRLRAGVSYRYGIILSFFSRAHQGSY